MSINSEEKLEKIAVLLKLLGDKTRLRMVTLLQERECCVCEFVDIFQMSQPSISQHLRKLKDVKLVNETRKGQWIFYSLNQSHELYSVILSVLSHVPEQQEQLLQLERLGKNTRC